MAGKHNDLFNCFELIFLIFLYCCKNTILSVPNCSEYMPAACTFKITKCRLLFVGNQANATQGHFTLLGSVVYHW